MSLTISTAARNASCNAVLNLINQGSLNPSGHIELYTGSRPTSPDALATGTRLATMLFANPAFAQAVNGQAIANTIAPDTNLEATGRAGWFRIYNRDNVAIIDGTVTATGGGGDLELDLLNFVQGGTLVVVLLTGSLAG